jgi:Domain of unknown function (DUF5134)
VRLGPPAWLYYLFGVVMLVVAAYCLTLLILSVATRRPSGRDVEISHLFMGVAMAGMFVAAWSFGPSAVWELIFGALMIWFLVESVQSIRKYGPHLPHASIHAVMNFAMLLMYWFPMGSSTTVGMSMSMSGQGGSRLDPGVAFAVAVVLFASAIFTLASPNKGASHFGSHAPASLVASFAGLPAGKGQTDTEPGQVDRVEGVIATPWLVDLSHVTMCVAMGFMLLLMT